MSRRRRHHTSILNHAWNLAYYVSYKLSEILKDKPTAAHQQVLNCWAEGKRNRELIAEAEMNNGHNSSCEARISPYIIQRT